MTTSQVPSPPQEAPHDAAEKGVVHIGHVLVLLAVAGLIFFALSYLIEQSGAHAQQQERLNMAAAQTAQFAAVVETGVQRLMADGHGIGDIDFNPEGTSPASVFFSGGGGVAYQQPALLLGPKARWRFQGMQNADEGWFVAGIGSDDESGKDAFAYVEGIPEDVCSAINARLGLGAPIRLQSVPVDFSTPGQARGRAGNNAWTLYAQRQDLSRAETPPAACIQNGISGPFVFYHVIYPR